MIENMNSLFCIQQIFSACALGHVMIRSIHSTKNRKLLIEYFGISIQFSSKTSVRLLRAVLCQDVRKVTDAIRVEGANVNELFCCWANDQNAPSISYTLTPLSLAVRFSTNRVVLSLLRCAADPNVKCDMTPLGVAVQRNNHRLVALLLDSGADINLLTHPVVKWKSSNDDEENRDHLMQTPLHIACRKGFVAMTRYLLLRQAATDIIDGSGNTPVSVARKFGHREVEVLILRDVACKTSMHVCPTPCPGDNISIVTRYERTSTTQLIMSCIYNDMKKASCLIAYGANVNATDASQNTALHYACANGNQKLVNLLMKNDAKDYVLNEEKQSPIQVALKYGYLAIVFILIEHKCVLPHELLFATTSGGNTLLHIACKQNRVSVVRQLLKRGAFLNVVNRKGKSPIHYAWHTGNIELRRIVVEYILQYARIETVEKWQRFDDVGTKWFKRFVELASYRMLSKVVSQEWRGSLVAHGEEVYDGHLCSACGKLTPDACYLMLSRGMCDLSTLLASCCSSPCEANCTSLLHIVCCKKLTPDETKIVKMVDQLIEYGADVNAVDCHGNTPLHLVCCNSDHQCVDLMVDQLIEHGADVNAVDCHGNTPLHLACLCDSDHQRTVISTLLDNSASPYIVNDNGKTALWCAFWGNYSERVRWLILHKKIDVDAEVLRGFNCAENTLLLMLATYEVDDELLWRLVERSARINVPPLAISDRSRNTRVPYREQPRLLDVLARNGNWSLIRKLVEVGCCDFTTEFFSLLLQSLSWEHSNERSMCSRMQMLKWFHLAGLGQYDKLAENTDTFLRKLYFQEFYPKWNSEHDSDNAYEKSVISRIFRPIWASTTANAKVMKTVKWLQHDMENPPSLSHLCVYTIRHELSYADPDGKSIFSSIDKLPLPTRLKNSLKLRDIKCDDKCFRQQPRYLDFIFGTTFHNLWYDFLDYDTHWRFLRRCCRMLYMFDRIHETRIVHESDLAKERESIEGTTYSIQRRPWKHNCTLKVTRKPVVRHSVRRSRSLLQPRRHQ